MAHKRVFPASVARHATKIASISRRLRKERELSFYGDEDFIPTEEYTLKDAKQAIRDAQWIVKITERTVSSCR